MKRSDLAQDQRFATMGDRLRNRKELDKAVGEWIRGLAAPDAEHLLQESGIPAAALQDSSDVSRDAQLAHRGYLTEIEHPVVGKTVVEGSRFLLSRTPAQISRPAPSVGGDNQYVLESILGYDEERITKLVAAAVIE
jgi:crotonobetainyl-CoA:carnitine CoA-transferase CaiB-like acyl-CoA transferase